MPPFIRRIPRIRHIPIRRGKSIICPPRPSPKREIPPAAGDFINKLDFTFKENSKYIGAISFR